MKILGHPVHPMLVVFPIGLYTTSVIFDAIDILGGPDVFGTAAFWNITVGLIGGALAAATGLADWLSISAGTRAKRIGLLHAGLNAVVSVLFLASWLLRLGSGAHRPSVALLLVEVVAIAVAGASAWYGGELAYRFGIGVETGANPNAPSSLSGRPAGDVRRMPAEHPMP
jgi:uncharacterized membrane protein